MNDNTKNNKNINIAKAGLLGIMLGAVGTTMLMLSDKEIRKSARKRASDVGSSMGKWGQSQFKNARETVDKKAAEIEKVIDEKQKTSQPTLKEKVQRTIH
jgi:hypothetical protein